MLLPSGDTLRLELSVGNKCGFRVPATNLFVKTQGTTYQSVGARTRMTKCQSMELRGGEQLRMTMDRGVHIFRAKIMQPQSFVGDMFGRRSFPMPPPLRTHLATMQRNRSGFKVPTTNFFVKTQRATYQSAGAQIRMIKRHGMALRGSEQLGSWSCRHVWGHILADTHFPCPRPHGHT